MVVGREYVGKNESNYAEVLMSSRLQWSVGSRLGFGLALAGLVVLTAAAQQRPAPAPAPANNASNFTGKSVTLDNANLRATRRHFEAGARSNWHVHPSMQVLLAEKGRGRAQEEGGEIVPLVAGRPIYMRAGVRHWHGADPDQELVQVAMTVATGADADWREPVTDEVYQGKRR
jgi:quercetin dioxygenase-like cupin family protein